MCLSTVYLGDITSGKMVMEEVSKLKAEKNKIELQTIFGEKKILQGYKIKEVDLTKNYILLEKRGKE